jgi:hypothetical protein
MTSAAPPSCSSARYWLHGRQATTVRPANGSIQRSFHGVTSAGSGGAARPAGCGALARHRAMVGATRPAASSSLRRFRHTAGSSRARHPGRRGRAGHLAPAAAAPVQPVLDRGWGDRGDVMDLAAHHTRLRRIGQIRPAPSNRPPVGFRRSRPGRRPGPTSPRPIRGCLPGFGPLRRWVERLDGAAGRSAGGGCEELRELRPNRCSDSATRAVSNSICRACASTNASDSSRDGSGPDMQHDQHT